MKEVYIYTTPSCHFCHLAKDFFKEKNIIYTEYNVAEDNEKRTEMIEMTGQLGVPVIRIGSDAVIGFNKPCCSFLLTSRETVYAPNRKESASINPKVCIGSGIENPNKS